MTESTFTIQTKCFEEAKLYMMAADIESARCEALQYIRSVLKHGDPSEESERHLEHIRSLLWVEGTVNC
jgi:hypothetical protein